MCGNLNKIPVGKCSQCGGVVSVPRVFMSVDRPVPQCERCHAIMDETHNLPVVPTIPLRRDREVLDLAMYPNRDISKRQAPWQAWY